MRDSRKKGQKRKARENGSQGKRAYMYIYGYRNLGAAQDLLADLRLHAQVCGDCGSCPVKCISGFPVSSRIRDVVRIREVPPEIIA